jgi:hypothetical protein
MDSDATALRQALGVLRQQYGDRLAGPQKRTQAEMRHTLQAQMGLDELTADSIVIKLRDTGRLSYVGSAEVGTEPGTTATGPVISEPLTQSGDGGAPLITTASPAMIMGVAQEEGGNVAGDVAKAVADDNRADYTTRGMNDAAVADTRAEAGRPPLTIGEHEEAEGDRTQGYWRIG